MADRSYIAKEMNMNVLGSACDERMESKSLGYCRFHTLKNFCSENASQADEIVNGADTVTANYVQFWFRRFRSGIFDVKGAPRTGRPVVKNVDKIPEIIDADRHVSSRSITQELRIDHKIVLKHFLRNIYCQQLGHLRLAIDQKRPELFSRRGVVFHQDNARPPTFVMTRQKLWELGWEVLMHP
ncbi:histone-lysine N-methyltransferase SETMAR [Trichonephila clavipes]|nr:histone-lysine N-methyltransferase SETMAR [Trichonephila clavipes]